MCPEPFDLCTCVSVITYMCHTSSYLGHYINILVLTQVSERCKIVLIVIEVL